MWCDEATILFLFHLNLKSYLNSDCDSDWDLDSNTVNCLSKEAIFARIRLLISSMISIVNRLPIRRIFVERASIKSKNSVIFKRRMCATSLRTSKPNCLLVEYNENHTFIIHNSLNDKYSMGGSFWRTLRCSRNKWSDFVREFCQKWLIFSYSLQILCVYACTRFFSSFTTLIFRDILFVVKEIIILN